MTTPVQTTYGFGFTAAIEGQLADSGFHEVWAMRNDEASAEIPFGRAVKFGSASDGASCKLPAAETDVIAGIALFSYAYDKTYDLGDDGILPGRMVQVLRKGRVKVRLEDQVTTIGTRGWVRAVAGVGELIGGILPADDGTDTIDCTGQIVFLEAGAAGAIVTAEVDFTNRPT